MAVAAIKWEAAWVSRGTVLTTELNSLASGAFSALGPAYDNTTNLDQMAAIDFVLATFDPTTVPPSLALFMAQSLDGTNYEDAPSATNVGSHMRVLSLNVLDTSSAKRIITPRFWIPPGKVKFALYQLCGVAFNASGSTGTLYTTNDEVQS